MDTSPEARLRTWLLRHSQRLAEQAVEAIDATEDLHKGVQYYEKYSKLRVDITNTQLRALLNTAHACSAKDALTFVEQRAVRREKTGKMNEARFWDAVVRILRDLGRNLTQEALADCGLSPAPPEEEMQARTLITRTYLEHFVAHCQYLQGLTLQS